MRLTSLVVWKSWASNPLRTTLTILGIALGVAVVTAIHVMDHNTIQSQLRLLRPDAGRVDLELVPADKSREPGAIRAALQQVDGIADVGLLHEASVVLAGGDPGRPVAPAAAFGLSPLPSRAFSLYAVSAGEDLTDLDGDAAVLLSEPLAAALGVGVGDSVSLTPPAVPVRARCVGGKLVRDAGPAASDAMEPTRVFVKGLLADTGIARRNQRFVVICSFPIAQRASPAGHTFYQVNRAYGTDADRLRQSLSTDFQVLDEESALLGEASDERAFRNGVKVLGGLALVLGMFVVFQTLSQSLVERLKQIGLLRCLGASRRSIVSIFFLDALLMAIVGVALGVGLGIALFELLARFNFTTLGVGKSITTSEIPIGPVLWTAGLGLLFTLTGAIFPLWKARNLPAVQIVNARGLEGERGADVLRGVHLFLFVLLVVVLPAAYLAMTPILAASENETRSVLLQLGGLVLAFGVVLLVSPRLVRLVGKLLVRPWRRIGELPAFLVERGLARASGRFAASVCGLAIVLLAIIAVGSITAAMRAEIVDFGDRTTAHRIFLGFGARATTSLTALHDIEGVEHVELHEGRRTVPFLLSGISTETLSQPGGYFESRPDQAREFAEGERSVLVSARLARMYGVGPGDALGVLTDEGRKPYRILAVTDSAGFWVEERAWAVTAPRWMERDFCVGVDSVTAATIRLAPGASLAKVRGEVRKAIPDLERIRDGAQIIDYHLRDLRRDFALFDVLLGLILLLAVTGLVNQMTIAALSRVREIGVLRALGMSHSQLRRRFFIESMSISVLAAALAVVLGVPLGWLVVNGLNRVAGLEAPYVVPWLALAVVVVTALIVGWVASILPGARAARMSPAESVRYE